MPIDRDAILFFDASCLIAAAGSPSGGSGFLLSLCRARLLRAAISQPVLLEAERNIPSKLGAGALDAYHRLIVLTPLLVVPLPPVGGRATYADVAGTKDEHVVAAALVARAQFLLTLDKRLATRVNDASLGTCALSPGEFIKTVLPNHVDYARVRD